MENVNMDLDRLKAIRAKYEEFIEMLPNGNVVEFQGSDLVLCKDGNQGVFFSRANKSCLHTYVRDCINNYAPVVPGLNKITCPSIQFVQKYIRRYYSDNIFLEADLSGTPFYCSSSNQRECCYNFFSNTFITVVGITALTFDLVVVVLLKNKLFPTTLSLTQEEREAVEYWSENGLDSEYKIKEGFYSTISQSNGKDKLLNCEKIRADIDPYDELILKSANRGHWDLWEGVKESLTEEDAGVASKLTSNGFYARNPEKDIRNGVVGIDFGTKSTVVCFQASNSTTLPMAISRGSEEDRYENPTVMRFLSLEKFHNAYQQSNGRPETEWNDLMVSHEAANHFKESSSNEFFTFMTNMKQWAADKSSSYNIQSRNVSNGKDGYKDHPLKPFLELADGDFNPIEVYAYYIGLYINNMNNGIYLKYYLSFPVTYPTDVKRKITESFEKGLRKSMPPTVLNNEELMKGFYVDGSISEPLAYAVCALQQYGFEPEGEETIHYGIFDFGGGTTDFDFGIWKEGKGKYDYSIETFGGGGIKTMGGENLLADLAFSVFCDNKESLKKDDKIMFNFKQGPSKETFPGMDLYIKDTDAADKNMHNLAAMLRPYWEKSAQMLDGEKSVSDTDSQSATSEDDETITLMPLLHDVDGAPDNSHRISTTKTKVRDFIKAKISSAIQNFFDALALRTKMDKGDEKKLHIFLAGNSCKSPYVIELFNKKIDEVMTLNKKDLSEKDRYFEIFPALGSSDAIDKMRKRNVEIEDPDNMPTGKTGVAYGLVDCRKGGTIDVRTKDIEAAFQFYIGYKKKKNFRPFESDDPNKPLSTVGKPKFNVWYRYMEADVDEFSIYYTERPECINGDMKLDKAEFKTCHIDTYGPDKYIFVLATNPHTLKCVVASEYDEIDKISENEFFEIDLKIENNG